MHEPDEKIKYDLEAMCLPNSLEFAARKLLGEKANKINFEKYRIERAKQLEEESKYSSPIKTAKRENQDGTVVWLIAQNRDEFVKRVLEEIGQQTREHLTSRIEYKSGDNLNDLTQLVNQSDTVCLLSIRGHIKPLTNSELGNPKLVEEINDSFELAPYGNITIISKT